MWTTCSSSSLPSACDLKLAMNHKNRQFCSRLGWLILCLAILAGGCGTSANHRRAEARPEPESKAESEPESESESEPATDERVTQSGARLWSQSCTFCHHYLRDASYFSQAEWDIIMMHMRLRANLTAAEHRAILQFLKSAN